MEGFGESSLTSRKQTLSSWAGWLEREDFSLLCGGTIAGNLFKGRAVLLCSGSVVGVQISRYCVEGQ